LAQESGSNKRIKRSFVVIFIRKCYQNRQIMERDTRWTCSTAEGSENCILHLSENLNGRAHLENLSVGKGNGKVVPVTICEGS
jgi:hypothetical protein